MQVVTLEEYVHLERPALQWLVHGLIPRPGFVILVGESKSGKSFLALQVALAVARGERFLGHETEQGVVLYLQFDTSETVWRDRLTKLKEHHVDINGTVYMVHPADQPTWANIQTLDTQRVMHDAITACNPDLIVIDVLREIHSADENDSTEMKVVIDILRRLVKNRATLLLHHTHKLGADEPRDPVKVLRGSSYIAGMVESAWLIDKERLYIRPRFAAPTQHDARQQPSGLFTFPSVDRLGVTGIAAPRPLPHLAAPARGGGAEAVQFPPGLVPLDGWPQSIDAETLIAHG